MSLVKKMIKETQVTPAIKVLVEKVGFIGTAYYRVLILENGEYSEVFHTTNKMRDAMNGFAGAVQAVSRYATA